MESSLIKGQGIIGARIKFSSAELLAITLLKESFSKSDTISDDHVAVTKENADDVIELLGKLSIDISGLEEARKSLFSPREEDAETEDRDIKYNDMVTETLN